ncbi:MAG: phosphoenolpyruvate-utilizing N-terminal domain-containing protein, partial [Ignavibacteria bacterium]
MITLKEEIFKGLPASKGISMGKAFVYKTVSPSYVVPSTGVIDPEKEIEDYTQAISQSRKELDKIFTLAKEKLDVNNLQIF